MRVRCRYVWSTAMRPPARSNDVNYFGGYSDVRFIPRFEQDSSAQRQFFTLMYRIFRCCACSEFLPRCHHLHVSEFSWDERLKALLS